MTVPSSSTNPVIALIVLAITLWSGYHVLTAEPVSPIAAVISFCCIVYWSIVAFNMWFGSLLIEKISKTMLSDCDPKLADNTLLSVDFNQKEARKIIYRNALEMDSRLNTSSGLFSIGITHILRLGVFLFLNLHLLAIVYMISVVVFIRATSRHVENVKTLDRKYNYFRDEKEGAKE